MSAFDALNPFFFYEQTKMCAVCLKSLDEKHPLTEEVPNSNPAVLAIDVLKSISQFNITSGPDMLCSACFKNVKAAYKFQTICNQAQEYYEKFKQHEACKEETSTEQPYQEDAVEIQPEHESELPEQPNQPPVIKKKRKRRECKVCFKMVSGTYLSQHMLTHTGEKPHQCEICKKCYAEKQSLKKHMLFHNDIRNYVCNYCGQAFHLAGPLKDHIRIHTGEKPYICSYCNKGFRVLNGLKGHMRGHTGERPFQCEFCAKNFALKSNLDMHRKIHTNDKRHKCWVCDKAFIQRQTLMGHLKTHDVQIKVENIESVVEEDYVIEGMPSEVENFEGSNTSE